MGPLDLLLHVINFVAPAVFVAALVALMAHLFIRRAGSLRAWFVQTAAGFGAGVLVLGAGLVLFGLDGKMATYAGLVGACALAQWLAGRYWR